MQFEISDDERSVLVEVLDQAHRNLKEEIYKTETRSFKDELKEREELLVGLVARREEAVLLVREELVEGVLRAARTRDDVADRRVGEAVLGDRLPDRVDQPAALRVAHVPARELVPAAWQRRGFLNLGRV